MNQKPYLRLVVPAAESDVVIIARAFDDPALISGIVELSKTNEFAMRVVRVALRYHVVRWHRLMHPGEALPQHLSQDELAALQDALSAAGLP